MQGRERDRSMRPHSSQTSSLARCAMPGPVVVWPRNAFFKGSKHELLLKAWHATQSLLACLPAHITKHASSLPSVPEAFPPPPSAVLPKRRVA